MAIEKERKYLPTGVLPYFTSPAKDIKQGYLMYEKGKQLRVRIIDDTEAFICYKSNISSDMRHEYEYPIPMTHALELFEQAPIKLRKKRHSFKEGNLHYDVDYYPDNMVVIEVEFEGSLKETPKWCGEEITGNKQYSNITIAKRQSLR